MKVLFACTGEGFGHVKPLLAVAKKVMKKHDVHFVTFGPALDYLREQGFQATETKPDYLTQVNEREEVDLNSSLSLLNLFERSTRAVLIERKLIKEFKPDLIYSDGKITTALLGARYRIPVFFAGNQLSMYNFLPRGTKKTVVKALTNTLIRIAKLNDVTFIVRDFPQPYDISEGSFDVNIPEEKLVYVGPIIWWSEVERKKARGKKVLCYMSKTGLGKTTVEKIASVARDLPEYDFSVWSNIKDLQVAPAENLSLETGFVSDEDRFEKYKKADAYFGMAGHSSIMDCLCFGIPVILSYPKNHVEQELNALNVEKKGVGVSVGANPSKAKIKTALLEVLENKRYKENALFYASLYEKHNGAKTAAKLIEHKLKEKESKGKWFDKLVPKIDLKKLQDYRARLKDYNSNFMNRVRRFRK